MDGEEWYNVIVLCYAVVTCYTHNFLIGLGK